MPVTDGTLNKRTGRPCYLLAIKITNGNFIFFYFQGLVLIFPSQDCSNFFSPISDFYSRLIRRPWCMPVILASAQGGPAVRMLQKSLMGNLFFLFSGGGRNRSSQDFFFFSGCELFFFIFPISDFHSITIAGPLCVPVDDSSGLFFLSADEPLTQWVDEECVY